MKVNLFDFEKKLNTKIERVDVKTSDEIINQKYEKGEARIITEQGAIKLPLVTSVFESSNYTLKPDYQRRITWDNKKRSKLIESFIMNVPIPPIFIYETDFGKYQVMDGLQRISTIIDFYENRFFLEGLLEWRELNGRKYGKLPEKVKEGIDRRQITVVTLLKESAKDKLQEEKMKKMVFERLNTGGVKLVDQEVRNALYPGKFNNLCLELSVNDDFRALWKIPKDKEIIDTDDEFNVDNEIYDSEDIIRNKLYMRMYDVELVLRYFAMRHVEEFNTNLSNFLDICLIDYNEFNDSELEQLKLKFNKTIKNARDIFGEKAFCQSKGDISNQTWTGAQKMIYDPLMLVLSDYDFSERNFDIEKNLVILKSKYNEETELFNGKKQSKTDIIQRMEFFKNVIESILSGV